MDDLIQEFLTETTENLAQLDVDIVALEKDNNNTELLSNIFRTIHTIKGTCGFIGLSRLEKVAHAGENVLGKFRDGDLEVTPGAITVILECIDRIKDIIGVIEETGSEPEGDDAEIIVKLDAYYNGDIPVQGGGGVEETPGTSGEAQAEDAAEGSVEVGSPAGAEEVPAHVQASEISTEAPESEQKVEPETAAPAPKPAPKPAPQAAQKVAPPPAAPQKAPPQAEAGPKTESVASQTIRVNVGLLENLITSVSELVLARNQLLQIARNSENDDFKVPLQRLNHVTSELQEGLMRTRMQPVGNAWAKLPRIIRDLAQDLGKDIELEMIGAETELDRQVIEIIKDPLMHMVRNSADHGLETPQERVAAGKPKKGRVNLKAYHAGGHVVIEIADNGRGLNRDKITQKIVEKGLASEEDVAQMSDNRIYNYIFAAGFSTAEKVTNVSGRGVGMDVVRTNIEKIGGTVEVRSVPGQGSVFTVKIPLTLAIVSALIIRSSDQKFAIPQVSIIELVQASSDSEHTVEYVKGHPVLRLRNKLLPLVTLSKMLNLKPIEKKRADSSKLFDLKKDLKTSVPKDEVKDNQQPQENQSTNAPQQQDGSKTVPFSEEITTEKMNLDQNFIVVAQVGSGQFGIIVDEVFDTEEIVVKPVSPILRQANIFAGNTILGDGSVVMILDPKGVAGRVGEIHSDADQNGSKDKNLEGPDERRMRFLIFKAGDGGPKAVPLSLVVRLEEIETDSIETSNGMHVIQYRDRLMPLTSVQGFVDYTPGEVKPVLVFSQNNEYVGLMVDEIVDIIEERLEIKMNNGQGGTYGSVVMAKKTTDLVDVDYFIQQICPDWQSMLNQVGQNSKKEIDLKDMVVFIDRCPLYRNLITPLLELRKIGSLSFGDANKAMNYLEDNPAEFSAVILDKESFGEISREEFFDNYASNFEDKPCFILGSTFAPEDEVFFQDKGCIACLAKSDRESIIATVSDYLEHSRSIAA